MTTSTTSLELDYIAAAAQSAVCPGLIDLMEKLLAAGKQHLTEGHNETALSYATRANEILVLGWIEGDRSSMQKIKAQIFLLKTEAYFKHAATPGTENPSGWAKEGFISAVNGVSFLSHNEELNWETLAQLYSYQGQYQMHNGNPALAQINFKHAGSLLAKYAPEHTLVAKIEKLLKVVS
jgi:hypothetical protein